MSIDLGINSTTRTNQLFVASILSIFFFNCFLTTPCWHLVPGSFVSAFVQLERNVDKH